MLLSPLSFPRNEGGLEQRTSRIKPGPAGHSLTLQQFVFTTGSPKQDPGVEELPLGKWLQREKTSPLFPSSFLDAAASCSGIMGRVGQS